MKYCQQCQGIEKVFDQQMADDELRDYHRNGPEKTTQVLLNVLKEAGVTGKSLLDIGGGVGTIQHELVKAGVEQVTNVDASTAYLNSAKREGARQGYAEQANYYYGDFVELAPRLEAADIVTLDRVICCYPDMEALVSLSAGLARQFYGVVFPQDRWAFKLLRPLANGYFWLTHNPYRFFFHSTEAVQAVTRRQGLTLRFQRRFFIWQVLLFERQS
jgi:magnesium-protoporphyrin O-methyltransferase